MSANEVTLKVVVVGETCAGKTSLIYRYIEEKFSPNFSSTIGIDFRLKTLQIGDTLVKVQVFDTAGQERYRAITKSYFRNAEAILLIYDITNAHSFNGIQAWVKQMETEFQEEPYQILVGNKSDLEQNRAVTTEQGKQLANSIGYNFIETSALNGSNVEEVFTTAINTLLKKKKVDGKVNWNENNNNNSGIIKPSASSNTNNNNNNNNNNSGGCC